jgi:hypothetical protein
VRSRRCRFSEIVLRPGSQPTFFLSCRIVSHKNIAVTIGLQAKQAKADSSVYANKGASIENTR